MATQSMILDPNAAAYTDDEIVGKINTATAQITRASSVAAVARPIASGEVTNTELAAAAGIYIHSRVNHGNKEYVHGKVHTNTIEGEWSLFKRGVYGIYHHVSEKHLQRYLDEFIARCNTRKLKEHERVNSFLQFVSGLRLTYQELIA